MNTLKPLMLQWQPKSGWGRWFRPQALKPLLPVVVLAIGLTALTMMFLWNSQSAYKPVFGARENVPTAEMLAVLDGEGIAYRLHPDSGQVLVRDDQLGRVRMLLAAKGVVAKLPQGLELVDRNDPLGVSQFVQDVRFRRGLEGELAQSIMALEPVSQARVHLSIARSSSFVASSTDKSSASVALTLHPGRTLGAEQIAAIINLVAGSVANLDAKRVSVVDQSGNLLSARVDLTEGFEVGSLGNEAAHRMQEEVRRNAQALLAPLLGDGNFQVSVTVEVDNDRVQETHERYGDAPKITNEAMREELDRDRLALGVPGSLSNRPVAAPDKTPGAEEGNTAQRSATTRQYAYDRSVTTIQRGRGQLRKQNVAVALNHAVAPAGQGWTAEDLTRMENLLRGGLGIDEERGDKLVVSAMPFPSRTEPVPWWRERENVNDMATWGAYALAALLAYLLVARPALRILQQAVAKPNQAELAALQELPVAQEPDMLAQKALPEPAMAPGGLQADERGMPVVPLLEDYDLPPPGSPVDVLVNHLRVLAGKEPERVAEVVKQWVQKNGAEH
ncbi:flagellar basal-body MS-ring/collar protein FliF [Hydrogenophaga aquatica]